MLPGFCGVRRKVSLDKVPTAVLGRQTAGLRGKALSISLPGQPRTIRECLSAVMPAVPWCIELIGGPRLETVPEVCRSYRPPGA